MYSTILENLKVANFLNRYYILKLNQGQINNLHRLTTPSKIETVYKSVPTTESPRPDAFSKELYKSFKELLASILLKLFHALETIGTLPSSFMNLQLPWCPSHREPQQINKITDQFLYEYRWKVQGKILANQRQNHVKKFTHHAQVGFILEIQLSFKI